LNFLQTINKLIGLWPKQNFLQNKIYEALALSEKAVELEPNAERSHLVLIQVARTTGDFNIIKEKVENALAINSAWAEDIKAALGFLPKNPQNNLYYSDRLTPGINRYWVLSWKGMIG